MVRNSKFEIKNSKDGVKPFFALAPMANITTYPFASQCEKFGADLVWTPMVHTDTIIHNWNEAQKILDFKDIKNYIIQLVGSDPGKFTEAINIIRSKGLKPLGFDLNAGCPDKNIVKSGCGGALMKDPDKIIAIVEAMQSTTKYRVPISVKTRAGFNNMTDIFELVPRLIEAGVEMITIHPRTVKQGYSGVAEWNIVKEICDLVHENWSMKVVGSGDIQTWQEAIKRLQETSCDGIMIGRGALGRPWIFEEIRAQKAYEPKPADITSLCLDLAKKAYSIWGDNGIRESRKHFAWYFRGFDGAKELRAKLMLAQTIGDVTSILKN